MTNINIELPDEIHKIIKLEAVKQDSTIKELVIKTLKEDLKG
ncbi:MAG: hypothetical protein ABIB43_02815 [archaeon]